MGEEKEEKVYRKVVIGGDGAVGKTTMCIRRQSGKIPTEYIPVKVDFFLDEKELLVDGKTFCVSVNDVEGGGEDWHSLRHFGYRGADCVVLCFSVISRKSFKHIEEYWVPFTKQHCPDTKFILVGTKIDLRNDPETIDSLSRRNDVAVKHKEVMKLSQKVKAECYLECSSMTGDGVDDVFDKAAKIACYLDHKETKDTKCCVL